MRILIINFNREFANALEKKTFNAFSGYMEVDYYGPGYSTTHELNNGLKAYIGSRNPYDALIMPISFLISCLDEKSIRYMYNLHRDYLSSFSVICASRYSRRILDDFLDITNEVKMIFTGDIDTVKMRDSVHHMLKKLLDCGFYVLGVGHELTPIVDENRDIKFFGGFPLTNHNYNLAREYYHRWISLPSTAATDDELFFGNLENRSYDWVVPGSLESSYPERMRVLSLLKKSGYRIWDNFTDRALYQKISRKARWKYTNYNNSRDRILNTILNSSKMYIPNNVKREEIARYRESYQECLRASKCAYADGGTAKCIVLKYFEIPAKGTVMLGDYVCGLDKLGFTPGVHMIEASSENIIEESKKIFADPDKMQQVASNGRKLVIEKHTYRQRALDFKNALTTIKNGKFFGSRWEAGEFIIEPKV